MEAFFIRALQLILSLSILVFLHEFGHFFFARVFKVRVDKFYMFFNPGFSLVRAKKINGKWQFRFFAKNVPANERVKLDADGDQMVDDKGRAVMEPIPMSDLPDNDWRKYPETTEWGIGWLPLGGYCKIAGMIDESMDKTQMALPPQKWEYRAKPVWQRLPIIIGGVFVNFILALAIYAAILFTWGQEYVPLKNAGYGLQFSETMKQYGFKNGDNIISIDGKPVEKSSDAVEEILINGKQNVLVQRDSQTVNIKLPADFTKKVLAAEESEILAIRYPFVIDVVNGGNPAAVAGLQSGDSLVSINGAQASVYQDIVKILDANKGKSIDVGFYRQGKLLNAKVNLNENGKLGVGLVTPNHFFKTNKIEYSFAEAIPAGISLGWETLKSYAKSLKHIFSKQGVSQLGGFGAMGSMFPPVWIWEAFWGMTAMLSLVLAFMNFLPIPALDGGHVLFLLYEMITGKKPSEKFLENAQGVGMILLLALLVFANGNDLYRWISSLISK